MFIKLLILNFLRIITIQKYLLISKESIFRYFIPLFYLWDNGKHKLYFWIFFYFPNLYFFSLWLGNILFTCTTLRNPMKNFRIFFFSAFSGRIFLCSRHNIFKDLKVGLYALTFHWTIMAVSCLIYISIIKQIFI